jgi:hypothetical protein
MKVYDITFANAVRLQNNKIEKYVNPSAKGYEGFNINYDKETKLATITYDKSEKVLHVGITNIEAFNEVKEVKAKK